MSIQDLVDRSDPSLPLSVRCGEEAWKTLFTTVLLASDERIVSVYFTGRRRCSKFIQACRKNALIADLSEAGIRPEKLQLLTLFEQFVSSKYGEGLWEVDWRFVQVEDLGEEFEYLRLHCISSSKKRRPNKTKTKAPKLPFLL